MRDYENIEVRSEKVRNIIGRIPPILIRSGITIISSLLIILLTVAWFIPYPESIRVQAEVTSKQQVIIYVPYLYITQIKVGLPVQLEMEGYNVHQYGYIKSNIEVVEPKVIVCDEKLFFIVITQSLIGNNTAIPIKEYMRGSAFILLSNKSIIAHLLKLE